MRNDATSSQADGSADSGIDRNSANRSDVADDHRQAAVEPVGEHAGERAEHAPRAAAGRRARRRSRSALRREAVDQLRRRARSWRAGRASRRSWTGQRGPEPAERRDRQQRPWPGRRLVRRRARSACGSPSGRRGTVAPASRVVAGPVRSADFLAAAFFAAAFFAAFFAAFLAGALRGGRLLRRRPRGPPLGEQLGGPLVGERLDVVALAQRGVGLAVGDVGAEPALLDHDRLAGDRVGAELLERRLRRRAAAALLGLGEQRQRLVERDGEQLLLGSRASASRCPC